MYSSKCLNKFVDKLSYQMLRRAAKIGDFSDILYLAIYYYYKSFQYREALSIIKLAKVKLAKPYIMYSGKVDSHESYVKAGGKSLSTKMSKVIAQDIALDNTVCFINELILEQKSSKRNGANTLFIPPFVLLYMLEIFCCKHINRMMEIQSALKDLQTVVNQGESIPQRCKDISGEILGICQHFAGGRKAALYSFEQSLLEDSFHKITTVTATRQRIDDLHFSE